MSLVPIVLLLFLAGCSSVGDLLSGEQNSQHPGLVYPPQLESVFIGQTTKEEVRNLFGNPTDLQVSSDHDSAHESWAYAKANPAINPLQFVPGFGVLALSEGQGVYSFSMSFSASGVVEGVWLREVQPYGDGSATVATIQGTSSVQPYGRNNPLTHHSK